MILKARGWEEMKIHEKWLTPEKEYVTIVYAKVDIDGIPDRIDFGTVSPDAIVDSWRTYKITSSW